MCNIGLFAKLGGLPYLLKNKIIREILLIEKIKELKNKIAYITFRNASD